MRCRHFILFTLLLSPCVGCQWAGQGQSYGPAQPFGQTAHSPVAAPGYQQTFPPGGPPVQPLLGQRAGQFVGNLAGGFLRSAVGGAGFTAGRDLWNEIIR